ncbi:MAG: hypothetical protein IKC71_00615 [Clostridia bacterium]|nr:hypothetical protein [Clostridia bacterium]
MEEKFLFVGVSPKPFKGKNYWYLDESGLTKPNTFVWTTMGRRDIEQIVYVDSVCWCTKEDAPYPLDKIKKIIRQTTKEEAKQADDSWFYL